MPKPDLARVEYQLVVVTAAGDREYWCDPANPNVVPTAFGRRSVLELPGYAPPDWLAEPRVGGREEAFSVADDAGGPGVDVPVTVWSPDVPEAAGPLPVLVAHDGPEYAQLAGLTAYAAAMIATGMLPPLRVALLRPVHRDEDYSASPDYLRVLTGPVLTTLRERYAVTAPLVLMGASLGGLTSLLGGLQAAPSVGGVFSQSGSFFQRRLDGQESGFVRFDRVCAAVAAVMDADAGPGPQGPIPARPEPLRVALTCGALEENAPNNRAMAGALRRAGHRVTLREGRDLHSYTAWRDALHPSLTCLLRDCWGATG